MLRGLGGLTAFVVLTALPVLPARAEPEDHGDGQNELEVAVAEGSGTGTFGCGQQSRVRYVRAAVQVRHTEASSEPDRGGATVLLGAAVDGSRVVALEDEVVLGDSDTEEPPIQAGDAWFQGRFGGHLRLGYRHRLFGIEGGFGAVIAPGATVLIYPSAEFTLGPRDRFWGFVGVGASQLTTQLVYAQPYLGLGAQAAPWLRLEGRWGLYLGGDSYAMDRVDLTWWVPCSKVVAFRGGLALGQLGDGQPVAHEASLGLMFTP
jgi:hypothetical protein